MIHKQFLRVVIAARSVALALAVVSCSTLLFAQDDVAPDPRAPAPAEAPDEPALPVALKAQPSHVQWNASIHFDQNGVKQGENSSLSIGVQVTCPAGPTPMLCRNLVIHDLVTDAGERLRSQTNMGPDWVQWLGQQNQREPRFHLHLQLSQPDRPCQKIALFRAQVDVAYATGPVREATLAPIAKVLGKRVKVVNVTNGELVVRASPQGLRLEVHRDANALLDEVKLVDSQGRAIPMENWGGGQQNEMMIREFRVKPPDDGKLLLRFYTTLKTVPSIIELRDIPLPTPGSRAGFDLAIEAVEVDAAAARGDDAAAPPKAPALERLEVQIAE